MAEARILTAGHCGNFARLAHRSADWVWTDFPASFGLILPQGGAPMLFDTGYSRHVLPAMARFPFGLYRRLLPISPGVDAADQLHSLGIDPSSVATIVISHFHPDHIGGLRDFPRARFVCSRAAWHDVRGRTGLSALRRGYLADLVPPDFEDRVVFAEDLPPACEMAGAWRLECGDEDVILVPLDGHIVGQLGMLVTRRDGSRLFFVADAVWRRASLADGAGPHPLAMLIHHDRHAYRATLAVLSRMQRSDPSLVVIPSHDPAPLS